MKFKHNLSNNGKSWTAKTTVYVKGEPKIRQKTFSLGSRAVNQAAAQKWLEQQERMRAGVLLSTRAFAGLGELVEMYLGAVEIDVQSVTLCGYERLFSYLLSHFDRSHHPLLSQQEIDWYIDQRRAEGAGRSIIAELNCLRRALARFHIDPDWTIPRWLQRIPRQERHVPSVADYHQLCSDMPPEAVKALRMALYGGLRDQEVYRVPWESYTHREAILRINAGIRKTKKSNVIPVVDTLAESLTPVQSMGCIVNTSKSCVQASLRRASRNAGITPWFGLQPARRLFVCLAEDEFDHDTISLVTGHSRTSMASRYSSGYGHISLKRKVIEYVEMRLA